MSDESSAEDLLVLQQLRRSRENDRSALTAVGIFTQEQAQLCLQIRI